MSEHYKATEHQLESHVDNMPLKEVKKLAMSMLGVCPLCEQITFNVNVNIGIHGECIRCPVDE